MGNHTLLHVYIAGPYRGATPEIVRGNIARAVDLAKEVILQTNGKWYPVIPHKNTEGLDGLQSDAYYLAGTMDQMRNCDAVLLVGGWENSLGTLGEIDEARRLNIPVYYNIESFLQA